MTAAICATIPRLTASRASSALDQRESGDAPLGRQLARQRLDLGHLRRGKNAAADPAEVSSSSPCSPSWQKRFRHPETAWRD